MKKTALSAVILSALLGMPLVALASPSSVDRITDHIQPLIQGDYIKGQYFIATSTTASSSLPKLNSTIFAAGTICLTSDVCRATWPVGTTYTATWPITLTGSAFGFNGLSTSTTAVVGNIPYFSGVNTFANVATGTISNGTGISVTSGQSIIGTGLTITNTGVTSLAAGTGISVSGSTGAVTISATQSAQNKIATTSDIAVPQLAYFTKTGGFTTLGSVATSTLTPTSPLTGSFTHVGTTGSIGCQTASGSQAGCLSSADWTTFNGKQAAGNYITALTGDVTASGPGSVASTLATVNSNVGSFTYGSFTVNGKGLITAASSGVAPITALGSGWATTTGATITLSTTTQSFNGLTFAEKITVPNASSLLFTPNVSGTLNNAGLTNSSITVNNTSIALGASGTITAASSSILGDNNTFTGQDKFSFASTTLASLTNFYSGLTGVLIGNGANSLVTAGSAQTCTNQFFRALSATYSVTCASVGDADFSGQLAVNHGGTGAASLTGLLQGNGASAFTAVTGTAGQFPYYNGTNTLLATSTLFLSAADNVGIGTTTPWGKLSVSTTAQQDGSIPLFAVASTTNDSFFNVMSNGNVGIGKTNPTSPLWVERDQDTFTNLTLTNNSTGVNARTVIQIASNSSSQLQFENYGTNNTAVTRWGRTLGGWSEVLGGILGNGMAMGTFGATPLILGTNGNAIQTITSGGNVGIGTTTPLQLLELASAASTTLTVDSTAATKGGCILLKDADGTGYTELYGNNGTLFSKSVSSDACQ